MKSITLKNISKSFQSKTLFEEVSFSVQKGDRVAITGHNGAGKSTLLKIVAGIESCDSGKLIKEKTTCNYIPQEFYGDTSLSIMEYLDEMCATARVFDILGQFGVISETQIENGYVHELSGGQKRILEISAVLSCSPMFLCIDEPENHLDIKARSILTNILKQYRGAVLFVSHDRYLVNQISNKIVSIQNEQAILTTGKTYEEFMAAERQKIISATANWKAEARALDKLNETVRMLKARTKYNDAQAKTYQMKKRQLEERRENLGNRPDIKKKVEIQTEKVRQKTGKLIFRCSDVQFSYPKNKALLEKVNVQMNFGERVVLLGLNGTGKTTFLKLLQQQLNPDVGEVRVGNNINIQYINQAETLDVNMSPLKHFQNRGFTEESARSLLAQFLFTQTEASTSLKILSGGQQQRFTFLLLFKTKPECLVLDEPTNNLDPETWELLLDLINEYTGSLLLISHDRSFIEQVENKKLWVLKNKTLKESWSDVDEVLRDL